MKIIGKVTCPSGRIEYLNAVDCVSYDEEHNDMVVHSWGLVSYLKKGFKIELEIVEDDFRIPTK